MRGALPCRDNQNLSATPPDPGDAKGSIDEERECDAMVLFETNCLAGISTGKCLLHKYAGIAKKLERGQNVICVQLRPYEAQLRGSRQADAEIDLISRWMLSGPLSLSLLLPLDPGSFLYISLSCRRPSSTRRSSACIVVLTFVVVVVVVVFGRWRGPPISDRVRAYRGYKWLNLIGV